MPDDLDRELDALLEGRVPRPAPERPAPSSLPPAVVAIRAINVHEPLIGHRARFQLTSIGDDGQWLAYGWRDGLRVVSEPTDVQGMPEPGVWVQEEADYYRTLAGASGLPRFAAGISRLWIEHYVSQESLGTGDVATPDAEGRPPDPWLTKVVADPYAPRVTSPTPAREAQGFLGRRAIVLDRRGRYQTGMRIVDEPTCGADGEIFVTVVEEADWFGWSARSNSCRHPSLQTIGVELVWVEG